MLKIQKKKKNLKIFLQFCEIFSYEPSYQLYISYDVELSFKPLLERTDWWLLSWKTWTLVIQTDNKSKNYKRIVCSNFYIFSWICATIGMYKTISTDAKNAPTWNTAISTILDTKILIKIHCNNSKYGFSHLAKNWNKSYWAMLFFIISK